MADHSDTLVLVTGGTGFISSHTVKAFLDNGYRVRTTCRDPDNKAKAAALYKLQEELEDPTRLEIVKAEDLNEPNCWVEAAKGCHLCAHLASPFYIAKNKKDEEVMCEAAVNGTLNVLRACEAAGITRVVLTSSMAAVAYGHEGLHGTTVEKPEEMWSIREKVDGYILSKLLAERAAWEYVEKESKNGMVLSTINPCWVVGPPLSGNGATSHEVLSNIFQRKMPAIPDLVMNAVDVRDVALAHVRALERDGAKGQRFCAVSDPCRMRELAARLREIFGPLGYKLPSKNLPKWILSVASLFNKQYKAVLGNTGVEPTIYNTSKSSEILGITYRTTAYDSHIEQAHALIQHGAKGFAKTPEYEEWLAQQNGGGAAASTPADADTAETTDDATAAEATTSSDVAEEADAAETTEKATEAEATETTEDAADAKEE